MRERVRRLREWLEWRSRRRGAERYDEQRTDALHAAAAHNLHESTGELPSSSIPPGYFPRQDEGRPRT